jgi:hypothetical protein
LLKCFRVAWAVGPRHALDVHSSPRRVLWRGRQSYPEFSEKCPQWLFEKKVTSISDEQCDQLHQSLEEPKWADRAAAVRRLAHAAHIDEWPAVNVIVLSRTLLQQVALVLPRRMPTAYGRRQTKPCRSRMSQRSGSIFLERLDCFLMRSRTSERIGSLAIRSPFSCACLRTSSEGAFARS